MQGIIQKEPGAWRLLRGGLLIVIALTLAACGSSQNTSTVDTGPVGSTAAGGSSSSGGGTASSGSSSSSSSSGGETVLYAFAGRVNNADGVAPYTGLVEGGDGNLYGLTYGGGGNGTASLDGATGVGTAYEITTGGTESVLYAFGASSGDAALPSSLIQSSNGHFYGVSFGGGNGTAPGNGTVFSISGGIDSVLYAFGTAAGDGTGPNTLLQGVDGNFYGTTGQGGAFNNGTVFQLTPQGVETVLYSFGAAAGDGSGPNSLMQASDGNFYGTTSSGGANSAGTVFKLTPTGVETVLWVFGGTADDGLSPAPSTLVAGKDGNFYGATNHGGANGDGIIYRLTPGGSETVLYAFGASASDGINPVGLRVAGDGNLYGATSAGGGYGQGTVFGLTLAGSETVMYSFGATTLDGLCPVAGPIQGPDHNFYGTTSSGGIYGGGTVYKLVASGP